MDVISGTSNPHASFLVGQLTEKAL